MEEGIRLIALVGKPSPCPYRREFLMQRASMLREFLTLGAKWGSSTTCPARYSLSPRRGDGL